MGSLLDQSSKNSVPMRSKCYLIVSCILICEILLEKFWKTVYESCKDGAEISDLLKKKYLVFSFPNAQFLIFAN